MTLLLSHQLKYLESRTFTTSPTLSFSSSVSKDEVTKFSSMTETWWEYNNNPLISMNPTRVSFIVETLRSNKKLLNYPLEDIRTYNPLKGLKAIDVGCGGGLLSESLARLGANVTAIDPSEPIVTAARDRSRLDPNTQQINYKGGVSVEEIADEYIKDKRDLFDIVCVLEVIEHTKNPLSLIRSAASLLKKPTDTRAGGMLFVSTINRTAKSFALAIVGGEYLMQKLPIGTHEWTQFLSPQEVQNFTEKCDLKEVSINGMVLSPPFLDMRWKLDSTDVDVNWIGAYSLK